MNKERGGLMANYVYNKIICTKEVLNKYFLDDEPFEENKKVDELYITFNKLFNIKLDEKYSELYGECIYYGDEFEYNDLEDGNVEIFFNTRWRYPIKAIVKALELCKNDIIWYAVQENLIYVSKFYWNDEIIEETLYLEDKDDFGEFIEDSLDVDSDFWVWKYKFEDKNDWKIWQCNNFYERYFNDYPAQLYYKEMRNTEGKYYFLTVKYEDYSGYKEYNYISEDSTVIVGDRVLVDRAGNLAIAEVLETGYYDKFNSPFPVERTKKIIKKVDKDFYIEDIETYNDWEHFLDIEDSFGVKNIKMNIDDTYFEFGITKYVQGQDDDEKWTNIKIKVNNAYFKYFNKGELMTSVEVDKLLKELEKLLDGKLKKHKEINFYEPDLKFDLYPKINLWHIGKFIYIKPGHEMQDIYMELTINLTDKDGAYIGQKYSIIFDRKEIEQLVKYIKSVVKRQEEI